MAKVIVIGLDGATWNLLEPWAMDGSLPTIKSLMDSGVWGELESTIPPVTFPAWKCYSTGKNPGKLGVYNFFKLNMIEKKKRFHDSRDFKSREIWDFLGDNGLKCGIINMPTTYPPKSVNGFMVAGYPSLDNGYTFPPSLEDELENEGYIITPKLVFAKERIKKNKEYLKEIFSSRFELSQRYVRNLDFLHLTIFYIDAVQHLCWNDKEIVKDFWGHIDHDIKRLLVEIDDTANVILMSDHGFNQLKNCFYINNWLGMKGLLYLKKTANENQSLKFLDLKSVLKKVYKLMDRFHFNYIIELLPQFIRKKLKRLAFDEDLLSRVDWTKTKVIGLGMGAEILYFNKDILNSECCRSLKKELIKELESITDPNTGLKVMKAYDRDEIYHGPFVSEAPDLIIVPESGFEIVESMGNSEKIWGESPGIREAYHDSNGIFLAAGPDIKKGMKIKGTRIIDLAPTILHIFGCPIPEDMDGKVLKDIFKEDSYLAKKEIKYEKIYRKENIKNRIRELKLLGKL